MSSFFPLRQALPRARRTVRQSSARAFLLAVACLAIGCGPTDLADNVENPGPIAGPFPVSRFFTASGFMGDGMLPGFLLADVDEHCLERPTGALGNCYRFTYNVGDQKWAGVYWQYPANNWGSRPGRSVAASFSHVRFSAAAKYSIVLPAGGGTGAGCADATGCRSGFACAGGACQPAGTTELGGNCLVSAECAGAAQCVAQVCEEAGAVVAGQVCLDAEDAHCADGLRCSDFAGAFQCALEGTGDVGSVCETRNECQSGLFCDEGECKPRTLLRRLNFMVGGLRPTRPDLIYSDEIGVAYFPGAGEPLGQLTPDYKRFRLDLSVAPAFSSLLGAFMWAVPFPNIDEITAEGVKVYGPDPTQAILLYFDDIVFELAQ